MTIIFVLLQNLPGAGVSALQPDGGGDALPAHHLPPRGGAPAQGAPHCRAPHPGHRPAHQVCAQNGEAV